MGSTPSTPNRESSDDPWWPIENQNLNLNPNAMDPVNNSNSNENEQQEDRIENCEASISSSGNSENSENEGNIDIRANTSSLNESSGSDIAKVGPESSVEMANCEIQTTNRQQSLAEFKEELRIKREMRTNAITELRNEITSLRRQLAEEKETNKQLIYERNKENLCQICNSIYKSIETIDTNEMVVDSNDQTKNSSIVLRKHLADVQFSLQNANAEILTLSSELAATKKQAKSLKEVIAASKEIIEIRETELSQLKSKLKEIENSLAERELHVMSENLRQEYDRQLTNIRNLRALYEERARISAAEKENLNRQLETSRAELNSEIEKNKNLEDHIASLDADLKSTSTDLYAAKEKLVYYKVENKDLHDEMTVVNQLFGQLLAGFNGSNNIDIDRLTQMLEENRDLLNDITSKEHCKEGAAQIPKLLFDLVSQADNKSDVTGNTAEYASEPQGSTSAEETNTSKLTSAQEIMHNLPKVWRVLIELLNHQQLKPVELKETNQHELCYKSVQTPTGPQKVLSVSKTYIRLKDLIMEKKFLQKETKKLKNLNSHLECRLGEQEQRLGAVTIELNKTWNLVGRMQRQHRQLHTHEQVLRYQLQQKRRMLNELKEELEYCRRKWTLAKEKNNESQSQWETLRLEFSKRKESDLNNSAESGYSDSPASEDEEDNSISVEKPRNSRLKKKMNIEKFLLTADQSDRKVRIQSVSPVRTARESITRRNSDSHITQFATEEFQTSSDVVQPIVHTVCAECGENCVKHLVHFDSDSVECQQAIVQVKVSEPDVHNPKPNLTNAQKLVEAKASTSKTKMCCELRKTTGALEPTTSKHEESLEEMFMRLSGSSDVPSASKTDEPDTELIGDQGKTSENARLLDQEKRDAEKLARIERLEGQCKLLMEQVTRTSNRNTELNKRADNVYSRWSEVREVSSSQSNNDVQVPQPSTSGLQKTDTRSKTDEECLTPTEQEYLARRDERLKRLEAESQAYFIRVKSMKHRAASVDTKLDAIRAKRGENESQNGENGTNSARDVPELLPSTSKVEKVDASSKTDEECLTSTERDYLSRRDERLKRLETEAQAYMNRVKSTNRRAIDVETQLEYLHGRYSEVDAGESSVNAATSSDSPTESQNHENQNENQDDDSAEIPPKIDENQGKTSD